MSMEAPLATAPSSATPFTSRPRKPVMDIESSPAQDASWIEKGKKDAYEGRNNPPDEPNARRAYLEGWNRFYREQPEPERKPWVFKNAEDETIEAAGLIIVTKEGRGLFLKRSDKGDHAGEWCFPGGVIEEGEEPKDTAIREMREETQWIPEGDIHEVNNHESDEDVDFTTFEVQVNNEFIPTLNDEHTGWAWAPLDDPPQPLHPGCQVVLDLALGAGLASDILCRDSDFKESEHPRDKAGKFGSGGSGGAEQTKKTKKKLQDFPVFTGDPYFMNEIEGGFAREIESKQFWPDVGLQSLPRPQSKGRETHIKPELQKEITIDPKELIPTQETVTTHGVEKFMDNPNANTYQSKGGASDLPRITIYKGKQYINQGHHRLAAAALSGKSIKVNASYLNDDKEQIPPPKSLTGDAFKESDHPRGNPENAGQFTSGSGGGGGKSKETGKESGSAEAGKPLSNKYSQHAKLKNGVVHTNDVYDATRALYEGRKVHLKQPDQVSVFIGRLGEITKRMVAMGKDAPNFNLCDVTVKGQNLFCADTKGIPRIQMPQLDDEQTSDFRHHLKDLGYKVKKEDIDPAKLRATQNELIGAKVAKIAQRMINKPERGDADKRLVISEDNYILDGHHHWGAQIAHGIKSMKVARVGIDIITLLKLANEFTGGKGAKGGTGSGDSIANDESDFDLTDNNLILSDFGEDFEPTLKKIA